ncbi:SGNH/GDSL hydrolase family protein [Brachybacterium sp. J144]|uniref:SGNH/GDSL hydrolase family protein n=1 Tax=Brachybacterium sp. J144 TaxID=3116487 RepID=UPI002E7A573D|nr:SGNH/GDSL hydrolase family protein [Brachybacterium sp. J144]MEE1651032.1 SGNH/GDSL hydrolase family protein [Brachybacterium sp. J144]
MTVLDLPGGTCRLAGQLDTSEVDGAVRPLRLPRAAWSQFPPGQRSLWTVFSQASGVRVEFRTDAQEVVLTARLWRVDFGDLPGRVADLAVDIDGVPYATVPVESSGTVSVPLDGGEPIISAAGKPCGIRVPGLPARSKVVTLWLPQSLVVDIVDVTADQPITLADEVARPRWIHYGSSISHCLEASSPQDVWPVAAAHAADVELLSLGVAGQCMLDPFVAEAIADADVDVLTMKVGINMVGARSMDQRTFVPGVHGFLDTVRRAHPDIPIVVASSILWPGNEDRPGPSDMEILDDGTVRCFAYGDVADVAKGALTLADSREHLRAAVEARPAGERTFYLDGRELFGHADVDSYVLPDGLHPDTVLYREIGRRFADLVFGQGGLVPRASLD